MASVTVGRATQLAGDAPSQVQGPRRRYHFGSAGFVYVAITLLLALGAFNSQNNLLFWAFGFSLSTLVVSGVLSGAMLMGIDVRRERIEDAEAGGELTVRFRVSNRNRLVPAFALTIEELPALERPVDGDSAAIPDQHAPPPSTISRIEQPRAFVAHIGPRERLVAEANVRALRRGPVRFRAFVVHSAFPFGLIRKSLIFAEPAGAVIRPQPLQTDLSILDRSVMAGDSDRPGRVRGQGDEFHSLREYVPGDSPGSIAWKSSARRGVLLVRQALAPAPRRLWIVLRLRIDSTRADMLDEQAIRLAAAVVRRARELDLAVGLSVPVVRVHIAPRAQPANIDRLMHELGLLELGQIDDRGRIEPFPRLTGSGGTGLSRSGGGQDGRDLCVCIHAGEIDAGFSPDGRSFGRSGGVIHLTALDVSGPSTVGGLGSPNPRSTRSARERPRTQGGRT